MQRCLGNLLTKLLPPLLALAAVVREAALSAWVQNHETTLLLALFALVGSLLHPRLRYLMITTLCYGVSFLAVRDIYFSSEQLLPPLMDSHRLREIRTVLLMLIASLALFAAITESAKPGAILARRCYFGAAFLYFLSTGIVNFLISPAWQSIVMILTGIASLIGCCLAHRIVALEREDSTEDVDSDLVQQRRLQEAHLRRLRAKEWHDRSEPAIEAQEPLSSTGSSSHNAPSSPG